MTSLRRLDTLSPADADAVRQLVAESPGAADNPPISEQGLLQLTSPAVEHLLAVDGALVGYAQLDLSADPAGAELVATDQTTADLLLAEVQRLTPAGLLLWAHGAGGVTDQAARTAGLVPVRDLLQLRADLSALDLTDLPVPDGLRIRPFVPGQDDAAWLAVNAAAFAHHPEQGGWTQADLDDRLQSPWFDPAGFLLAERVDANGDQQLLGYHWTKVVNDTGEVYVLGVAPAAQGLRLGKLLLVAGLRHLRDAGLNTVLLYVDEDNTTAYGLYQRIGFTVFTHDVQFSRPVDY